MRSGWFVVGVVASAATAATCYRPNAETECALTCTSECPDGLVCGADSLCRAAGTMDCSARPSGPKLDASVDVATIHDAMASNCFGTSPPMGHLEVCPTPMPNTVIIGTAITIDTTASQMCERTQQINGPGKVCAIVGSSIYVNASVTATGDVPLAFISTGEIQVNATISVASHVGSNVAGAGGGRNCGAAGGGLNFNGGGGGAGGGYGSPGGSGGAGFGGAGGQASAAQIPIGVLGGCNGGAGGAGNGMLGALGGLGGGAVYFISRTQITINGNINASGASALGGGMTAGAGGGGAGGVIGLDAPVLSFPAAILLAAGGAGGQGGGASAGSAGTDATYTSGAVGGTSSACGGAGGKGGYIGSAGSGASNTVTQPCAGGGGGGGYGYIFLTGSGSGGAFIPPHQ